MLQTSCPDFIVKSSWPALVCPPAVPSISHQGSVQQPVTCVWSVGQSVITTDTAAATGLRLIWLMTGQSNLPVFELLYSSRLRAHTHTHTDTRMHARTLTKTHCTHWFTGPAAEGIPFIKRPPGCTLFVCLRLWLRFGSRRSPSLMSHPQRQRQNTVFMYFFIWSHPAKTRTRSRYFLIQGRESSAGRLGLGHYRERRLCLLRRRLNR